MARCVVALLWVAVLVGCRGESAEAEAWAEQTWAAMPLRAQAAQLFVVSLADPDLSTAPADSAVAALRARVGSHPVGGLLVRGGEAEVAMRTFAALQRGASVPMLVAAPMERGAGGFHGATEFPVVSAAAGLVEPEQMREAGRLAAQEARAVGVHIGLLDGVSGHALGEREDASAGAAAFLQGLRDGRVIPAVALAAVGSAGTASGRVRTWDRAWLEAGELPHLRAAIDGGLGGVVLPPVALPAIAGDTVPLPFSSAVVAGLLRRDLGFGGLILADLRGTGGAEDESVVRALAAGADLLLGVENVAGAVDAVVAAIEAGRLPRARVEQAARRILHAKGEAGLFPGARGERQALRGRAAQQHAADLFDRSTRAMGPVGATVAAADGQTLLVTPAGLGEPLAAELRRLQPGLQWLQWEPGAGREALDTLLRPAVAAAARVVYAEYPHAGAVAGRAVWAAHSAAGGARGIVEVRFLTQATEVLPLSTAAVVAWGDGAAAQVAAARALAGDGGGAALPPAGGLWPPARTLRTGAAAEAGMSEARLARVDAILERAVEDGIFPGAALAVGRRGVLVRQRGFGRLDREPGSPPVDAEHTLFDLASLTKILGPTAAAMALVDEGQVELDAPVARYLAAFSGDERERVTVRHLLAHTAGLPAGLALHGSAASPQDALRQIVETRLTLRPGAVSLYSDLSMIVLAEALAGAAGEPIDRLLARRVFRPLGMESTLYLPPLALRPWIAPSMLTAPDEWEMQGIVHDGTAFRLGGIAGHAGIFSTARDVAVFAQTMLNGGGYGVRQVFSPSTVAVFQQRQPRAQQRALGWDTPAPESSAGSFFSERSYGHTGFTGTSLWIDPDKDLFVVLLTNRTYDRTSLLKMLELRQRVHDAVARSITDVPVTRRPGAVDVIPPPPVRPPQLQRAGRQAPPSRPARRRASPART